MQGHTKEKKQGSLFKHFFPPPDFLTMPSAGVDISDQTIKFLKLEASRIGKIPVVFGSRKLSEGIVVGGEIHNEEELATALKGVSRHINTKFVRASLPEQKAYFFVTQVPADSTKEEIFKVLEFRLEEHVPLSPQEAVIDYDQIQMPGRGHQDHLDIGVTVYPRKTVEKYTNAFFAAGLYPLSFEIEAQAIKRSVVSSGSSDTIMIVDFGETSTGLSIVSHGSLGFTSTLDVAGSGLTEIIMKELNVKPDDVSKIKNTIGIVGGAEYTSLAKKLTDSIGSLTDEIKRHYSYWGTRKRTEENDEHEKDEITRLILCGGNANIKGLPEYLEREIGVPVERANVWRNTFSFDEIIPKMPYEKSLSYATTIGLALRSFD